MSPRVETGPTRIGNDHCGLFIRGDDCFSYAMCLESILTKREDRVSKTDLIVLGELLDHLRSTNESYKLSVEERENKRIAGLENMTVEQIDAEIQKRHGMLAVMIGNLYPAIVSDEIFILEKRKHRLLNPDACSSS